jgi:hypothetical protein
MCNSVGSSEIVVRSQLISYCSSDSKDLVGDNWSPRIKLVLIDACIRNSVLMPPLENMLVFSPLHSKNLLALFLFNISILGINHFAICLLSSITEYNDENVDYPSVKCVVVEVSWHRLNYNITGDLNHNFRIMGKGYLLPWTWVGKAISL